MWSRRCCFFRLSCFSSCRACGCCDSCTMHDEEHIITEENKKKVEESYFYRFCQGWNILVTTRGNPLVALLLLMQSVLVPIAMLIVMILAVVLSCVAIVVTFVPVILVSIAVFIYKIWDNSIVKEEARKKKLKQAAAAQSPPPRYERRTPHLLISASPLFPPRSSRVAQLPLHIAT